MPKRTLFTNVTPLPSNVTREVAIAMLHNHDEMIELNPMVIEHHSIKTPRDAPADEFLDCVWQELTDKVNYLPGGLVKGKVSYKACFHDLPTGLQTHIYAPTGLDIREKWSICGTLPGEMPERREMGSSAPASGLYLKEECDMRCNRFLSSFVRKNLDEAHKVLVERIMKKASLIEQHRTNSLTNNYQVNKRSDTFSPPDSLSNNYQINKRSDTFSPTNFYNTGPSLSSQSSSQSTAPGIGFQPGSHMAQSKILQSPTIHSPTIYNHRHQQSYPPPSLAEHPAFQNDQASKFAQQQQLAYAHNRSVSTNGTLTYDSSMTTNVSTARSTQQDPYPGPRQVSQQFIAELPGSDPAPPRPASNHLKTPNHQDFTSADGGRDHRYSVVSEMSSDLPAGGTEQGSSVSDIPGSPPPQTLMPYRYNPAEFQAR